MSSFFALTLFAQSCSKSDKDFTPHRTCSPATSVGDLAADCAAYCAVYNDCVGCGDAAETKCNELCLSQTSSTPCFVCALENIHYIVDRLTCDTFAADAGNFTVTWSKDACGQTCAP